MKNQLLNFYRHIENFDDFNYLMAILRVSLAPTLNNYKVGNMINLKNTSRDLKNCSDTYRESLVEYLKLEYHELRVEENSVLIYFYQPQILNGQLQDGAINEFLKDIGYGNCVSIEDHMEILKAKFKTQCPNEIGVFLGYPLEDVIDFYHKKKDFQCIGYWKCYNNKARALKIFEHYDSTKCIEMNKILRETLKTA